VGKRYRVLHEMISFPAPSGLIDPRTQRAVEKHVGKGEFVGEDDLRKANVPYLLEANAIEEDKGAVSVSSPAPAPSSAAKSE